MKRSGMFAFIFFLIAFSSKISFADEMDGAGAGDTGSDDTGGEDGTDGTSDENTGDIGDTELDDETDESGDTPLTADEIKELRSLQEKNQRTEMLNSVEKSIQTRSPKFNMSAVVAGLQELNKTDPDKAAYYNASEAGLEMYHKDFLGNTAESDSINSGSHSGGDGDMDSLLEKAKSGDKRSSREALARSKA